MSTMTLTAPERIYLQVADGGEEGQPFPADHNDITWCDESVLENEVEYIRADLASPSQSAQAVDVWAIREVAARLQEYADHDAYVLAAKLTRALSGEKAGPVGGWISVEERRPERNKPAIYWHKSEFGGFAAIADEWRDEHHLEYATHWMPYVSPTPDKEE